MRVVAFKTFPSVKGARPRQRHETAGAPLDILLSARAEYAGLLDRLDAVQRQYAHRRAKDKIYY